MTLPAGIAAEAALTQQAIALSVIRQNAQAERAIASILEQAASNVPVSGTRGANVNITA